MNTQARAFDGMTAPEQLDFIESQLVAAQIDTSDQTRMAVGAEIHGLLRRCKATCEESGTRDDLKRLKTLTQRTLTEIFGFDVPSELSP